MAASFEQLNANLATYTEQFNQVEAALTVEPDNEQLSKLKADLEEVITLTEELVKQSRPAGIGNTSADDATHEDGSSGSTSKSVKTNWAPGDKCMSTWAGSKDGQYYPCVIDEILEDGTCSVNFEGYNNQSEVTQVSSILPYDPVRAKETRNRRDKAIAEREYKKAKNLKKKQRFKDLEEQREKEKSKWQNFNTKLSKSSKGKPAKKSIFATSEHVKGKVGVGTCGISGKPMTGQSNVPKYHKGM